MKCDKILLVGLQLLIAVSCAEAMEYPSPVQPGKALATTEPEAIALQNDILRLAFGYEGGHIRPQGLTDLQTQQSLGDEASEFFRINAGQSRRVYRCSQFDLVGTVQIVALEADPEHRTVGRRLPGVQAKAMLLSPDSTFIVN